MLSVLQKIKAFISTLRNSKYLGLIAVLVLVAVIPLTVIFSQMNQDTRQRAAEEEAKPQAKPEEKKPEFIQGEVLVKLKTPLGKLKFKPGAKAMDIDKQAIPLSSVDTSNLPPVIASINDKYKIKTLEKVFKGAQSPQEELSKFKSKFSQDISEGKRKINEQEFLQNDLSKTYKLSFEGNPPIEQVVNDLKLNPQIEYTEPNFVIKLEMVPNDFYYSLRGSWGQTYPDIWGLKKINIESAWDKTTGSSSAIIAGADTGVDRNHEDLKDNIWINTGEVPDNGIDDDGNNYIDDYYGWNFIGGNKITLDDHGHGTHTVGTIAAMGNNTIGIVGVSWVNKIMTLKVLDANGNGTMDYGARAITYAADMGAKISSNSWGGCPCQSITIDDAIRYAHAKGTVVIVAADNDSRDALGYSPASSDMAITVSASDSNDAKASFSNFGEKIDVSAPGVDVLSLKSSIGAMCSASSTVGDKYCRASGTSMATPHVSGLAALLLSKDPTLSPEEIRQIIRNSAIDLGQPGKDKDFGYGRIDANRSLDSMNIKPLAPLITSPKSRAVISGNVVQFNGSVVGPNFSSYKLEIGNGRSPANWVTIVDSDIQVIDGTLATIDSTRLINDFYTFRLTATDKNLKTYQFQLFDVEVRNMDTSINLPFEKIASVEDSVQILATLSGLDINNNGKKEFIVRQKTQDAWTSIFDIYEYEDSNSFSKVHTITIAGAYYAADVGDSDGDSLQEFLIYGRTGNDFYIKTYESSSKTTYPDHVSWQLPVGWWSVGSKITDTDGDGKKEIVIAGPVVATLPLANGIAIYKTTADNNYQQVYSYSIAGMNTPQSMDIGMGRNGKALIFIGGIVGNSSKVYAFRHIDNNNYELFWSADLIDKVGVLVNANSLVYAGDLDNDGKREFIIGGYVANYPNLDIAYYLFEENDANTFLKINQFILPLQSMLNDYSLTVGDLNGDSKREIVISTGNKLIIFENTRDNIYRIIWNFPSASNTRFISVGDHNNNGRGEIIFKESGNTVLYELNSSAALPTPTPTNTPTPTPAPSQTFNLQKGWNLIGLAVDKGSDYKAADLLKDLNDLSDQSFKSTEKFTQIARWIGGGYEGHRLGYPFNDFPLVVGEGYLIKAERPLTATLTGGTVALPETIQLGYGWNLISFPSVPTQINTAEKLLQTIKTQAIGTVEISRVVDGGSWDSRSNFVINPGEGYFIRVNNNPGVFNLPEDTTGATYPLTVSLKALSNLSTPPLPTPTSVPANTPTPTPTKAPQIKVSFKTSTGTPISQKFCAACFNANGGYVKAYACYTGSDVTIPKPAVCNGDTYNPTIGIDTKRSDIVNGVIAQVTANPANVFRSLYNNTYLGWIDGTRWTSGERALNIIVNPRPTPTPYRRITPTVVPFVCTCRAADINKDNFVNVLDFSFLSGCYMKNATDKNQYGQSCAPADINSDRIVNGRDYACLSTQYSKKCQ